MCEAGLILPDNWNAVCVFCRCEWTWCGGMDRLVRVGISTQEVLAAARMLCIPRRDWPDVVWGVRVMVNAALPLINAKED